MNYVSLILLTSFLVPIIYAQSYNPADIPDPRLDPSACNRETNTTFICNPNLLITNEAANSFDLIAGDLEYLSINFTCDNETAGIQLAGLIVQEVTLEDGESTEDGMKRFALAVHNDWGVGDYRCDNGVMIVIGVENRYTYITTGDGVLALKDDINRIVDGARTHMRTGDYGGGMLNMAQEISDFFLYPKPPPPPPNNPSSPPAYDGSFDNNESHKGLYVFLGIMGGIFVCAVILIVIYNSGCNSTSTTNGSGTVTRTIGSAVNRAPTKFGALQTAMQKESEGMKKLQEDEKYLKSIVTSILSQWYDGEQKLCTNCLKEFTAMDQSITLKCGHKYCPNCPWDKCGECQTGGPSEYTEQEESEIDDETYYETYYEYEYDPEAPNPAARIPSPAQLAPSTNTSQRKWSDILPSSITKSSNIAIIPRGAAIRPIAPITRSRLMERDWMITLIRIQLMTVYAQYPEYFIRDSLTYVFIESLLRNSRSNSIMSLLIKFLALALIQERLAEYQRRMDDYQQQIDDEQERVNRDRQRRAEAARLEAERVRQRRERESTYANYTGGYGGGKASTGGGSGWGGNTGGSSFWGGGGASTGGGGGWGGNSGGYGGGYDDGGGNDWGGGGASSGGGGSW